MDIDKYRLKDIIRDIVINQGSIKNVSLALKVLEKTTPNYFETDDYHKAIEELVTQGDIVEVEYILSDADYRIKSVYFPRGTKILNIKGSEAA